MIYRMLVEDKAGVLDRIVGLIRRYSWNITFLLAFETEDQGSSLLIIKLKDGAVDDALTKRLSGLDCVHTIETVEDDITERIMKVGK